MPIIKKFLYSLNKDLIMFKKLVRWWKVRKALKNADIEKALKIPTEESLRKEDNEFSDDASSLAKMVSKPKITRIPAKKTKKAKKTTKKVKVTKKKQAKSKKTKK